MSKIVFKSDRGDRSSSGIWRLDLLGSFSLSRNGSEIAPSSKKNRALLAILALSPGQRLPREKLCGLLWGDRGEEQARSSLRQSMAVLRRELGEMESELFAQQDDVLALRAGILAVDVLEIGKSLVAGDRASLRQAVDLCRGELLADSALREAAFDDWLSAERRKVQDAIVKLHERLVESESGTAAVEAARKLLALDPLRETSHRLLMKQFAASGEKALALKQYEECERLLKSEFGVEPALETQQLKAGIVSGMIDSTSRQSKSTDAATSPAPDQADSASVAVLPFADLSEDRGQQYFADGLTEDLITTLAQQPGYFVIARDSAFAFRGAGGDTNAIATKLGVRHIVEGSVRRSGSRLRVNAHLIDTRTRTHIWSQRYDRELTDLFATQDDIVACIVEALTGRLNEHLPRLRYRPSNLEALDLVMRGRALWRFDEEQAIVSNALFERAIELDPNYSEPHFWLAQSHCMSWLHYGKAIEPNRRLARFHAEKAVELSPGDAAAHCMLAVILMYDRQHAQAEQEFEAALKINPHDSDTLINLSDLRVMQGRGREAVASAERALRADPQPMGYFFHLLGQAQIAAGDYETAVRTLRREEAYRAGSRRFLAAALALLGRLDEARQEAALFMAAHPYFRSSYWAETQPFEDIALRDRFIEAYRLAGLPD
jgi:TolB-like protein